MYTILPMSSLLQGLNICTGNNKSLSGEIKGVGSAFWDHESIGNPNPPKTLVLSHKSFWFLVQKNKMFLWDTQVRRAKKRELTMLKREGGQPRSAGGDEGARAELERRTNVAAASS
jgi:hypothetical protein